MLLVSAMLLGVSYLTSQSNNQFVLGATDAQAVSSARAELEAWSPKMSPGISKI